MEGRDFVASVISENSDRLNNLSKEIWANPENSFQEKHAHDILTQFLAEDGFEVERNFVFDTGFRATFGSSEGMGAESLISVRFRVPSELEFSNLR